MLAEIARINGALVSTRDAAKLLPSLSQIELESAWSATPGLTANHMIEDGVILHRDNNPAEADRTALRWEEEKRARAEIYASQACEFKSLYKSSMATLIGISGSTSYKSVSTTDDLDFFCITKLGVLWIFLTKSLLLARVHRLLHRSTARMCFSYVADESYAEREFEFSRDALFARDALSTIIIQGKAYYRWLLTKSVWIANYFPQLYTEKTFADPSSNIDRKRETKSILVKTTNLLFFALVGNYLRVKSYLLNRSLARQGKTSALFEIRLSPNHCVFESARYNTLRAVYRQLKTTRRATRTLEEYAGP